MNKNAIITILLALVAVAGQAQDVTNKADSGWLDTVSYDAADSVTVSLQLASKTAGETCSIRRISTMSKINLIKRRLRIEQFNCLF